jgi:TonB family protein
MKVTKDDNIGMATSIGIHALLLILLFFFVLHDPKSQETGGGLEIDFGFSAGGMGDIQPTTTQQVAQVQQNTATQSEVNEEALSTMVDEPTTTVAPKEVNKPVTKPEEKPEVKEKPQEVIVGALYNTTNKSGGQGDSNKPGDQGSPDGKPGGGAGGSGGGPGSGGSGTGVSYDLGGRGAKNLYKPEFTIQEEGSVRVKITVDRAGNVVNATTDGVRGSSTTNKYLHTRAIEAALKCKFEANPDASPEQIGYVTYNFMLK